MLVVISMIVFAMISLAPGGPMAALEENPNITADDVARLEKQLGLDQPVYVRYIRWFTGLSFRSGDEGADMAGRDTTCSYWSPVNLTVCNSSKGGIIRGEWGYSNATKRPVLTEIGDRLPNTIQLMVVAFLATLIIALPIGVLSALKQYSLFDHIATFIAFMGQAIPVFWFGLILIIVFNVWLKNPTSPTTGFAWSNLTGCLDCTPLMPGGGMAPYGVDDPTLGQRIQHMVLPVIMLALFGAGTYTRYMRGQMLEVIHLDYIRTARAKGLGESALVWHHAIKNAITPVITIMALQLPILFGGALFTETIFSWPGMGRLFYQSAQRVDYPVLMGIVIINAALIIFFNLLADLAYAFLDPRVRYE
ncbi:MAG: ABC transporter permease [Caldilineaceae bacterium]|nr:ABC transporter permease [Caldilineaceae bacterium]MBP8110314.1 ABC transporter permease [Caldilineaceae bacterium]